MMRVSDDDGFVRPRTGGSRGWENLVKKDHNQSRDRSATPGRESDRSKESTFLMYGANSRDPSLTFRALIDSKINRQDRKDKTI